MPYEADELTRLVEDTLDERRVQARSRTSPSASSASGSSTRRRPGRALRVGRRRADTRDGGGRVQADVEHGPDRSADRSARSWSARTTRSGCRAGCRRACSRTTRPTTSRASSLSAREGLSYGCGDAVIGVNPATDTAESTAEILTALDDLLHEERDPDAALRALARDRADEGARSRLPDGPHVPVAVGHGGRQPGVRDRRGAPRRGVGEDEGDGHDAGPEPHVLRDRAGLRRCQLGRAPRRRSGHARGALLRARAALQAVPGQHRRRLHRPRVPRERPADHARRARGSLHGQAPRHADGLRRVLHLPRRHVAGRARVASRSCSARRAAPT